MTLLFSEPERFSFFQAVRVLRRLYAESGADGPHGKETAAPIDAPLMRPMDEEVRFRTDHDLAFPTATVRSAKSRGTAGEPPQMCVSFFGVATPASFGSLPSFYAELAARNPAFSAFLDIFNHRLLELYYRAWEHYEITAGTHQGRVRGYERVLRAILGLGFPALTGRLDFERRLLRQTAILGRAPATAEGIVDLVGEVFGLAAEVVEGVATWHTIEDDQLFVLGAPGRKLGSSLVLGRRVRNAQGRFLLRLGPLSWREFCEHQPGEARFDALVDLLRLAVGCEFEFMIQLVLAADEVPPLVLGNVPGRQNQLGRSTWLKRSEFTVDADDVVFAGRKRRSTIAPHQKVAG